MLKVTAADGASPLRPLTRRGCCARLRCRRRAAGISSVHPSLHASVTEQRQDVRRPRPANWTPESSTRPPLSERRNSRSGSRSRFRARPGCEPQVRTNPPPTRARCGSCPRRFLSGAGEPGHHKRQAAADGGENSMKVPLPTWPFVFSPQAITAPFPSDAIAWPSPAEITVPNTRYLDRSDSAFTTRKGYRHPPNWPWKSTPSPSPCHWRAAPGC